MKILIAEDNADDRRLLRLNLEHHGCEVVIEASDGEEGLEKAKKHKPDVIISDALMPKMDGFQFLRAVKTDKALKDIPFIFYSAVYTGYKEAELAVSLGAEEFIIKPMEPEEFWAELQSILENCKVRKKKALTANLIEKDEEFLRKYSQVVAEKLEEKYEELQKTKAKIEGREKRHREILSSIRDTIIIADLDRIIMDANQPALRDTFGYEIEEIRGKNTRILYASEEGYRFAGKEVFDIKDVTKGKIIETEMRRKNGEVFNAEIYALKLVGEDAMPAGNIAIVRDITEKRKLEEQLRHAQKMESIGTLTGGIAHDFNNILTAIMGYASVIQMKMPGDDPLREYLEQILTSSERAAVLTQSLLAFSRKQISMPELVNLNDIVKNAEKLLLRVIGKDIDIKIMLSDNDLIVMADRGQLEQVLMNLVTNARDAMPEGGALTIRTEAVEFDEEFIKAFGYGEVGRYVCIIISDTGTGMDKATKEKIFEPFFTTKEVGKGTGLGLSIVYGIVKQHKGYINCYSELGRGTTFKIYIPMLESMPVSKTAAEWAAVSAPTGGTETILVAEDEESVRNLVKAVLEEYGYNVIEAADGEEAVNKFMKNKDGIDLLLLDIVMPKMNGREAYERIAKIRPGIKILFASGYPSDIITEKGIIEEGFSFASKPMSPTNLLKKVREVLDK